MGESLGKIRLTRQAFLVIVFGSLQTMEVLYMGFIFLFLVNGVDSKCDVIFKGICEVNVENEVYEQVSDMFPRDLILEIAFPPEIEPTIELELESAEDELNDAIQDNSSQYYYVNGDSNNRLLLISNPMSDEFAVQGEITIDLKIFRLIPHNNSQAKQEDYMLHYLFVEQCKNEDFLSGEPKSSEERIGQRYKRSLHTYSVELLMVVDNAIYSWWKSLLSPLNSDSDVVESIQHYYAYVLKEIDNRFLSIRQDVYEINMAFSGLIIAKSDEESYWTSTSIIEDDSESPRIMVNSSEALEKFQQWLDNQTDLPNFDHAILFTGADLTYAGNPGNTGLAFEASMCRNISNSSIVEESFDARTVTFAVRQIARSLGARDDMDNNDCLEFFNFIMAPKFKLPIKSFPSNRWLFSTCSIQYFQEYIESLNEDGLNCLHDISLSDRFPLEITERVEQLPGQYYSAQTQCEHKFGNGSDICRVEIGRDYDELCKGLWCTVPGTDTCSVLLPHDGTPCGNMKYCHGGECSAFDDAEKRVDSCVYGNEPGLQCEDIISNISSICYNDTVSAYCCMSCAAREISVPDCEYGDRIQDCCEENCSTQDETYTKMDCCLTCFDGILSNPSTTVDMSTPFTSISETSKSYTIQPKSKAALAASSKSVSVSFTGSNFNTLIASLSTKSLLPKLPYTSDNTAIYSTVIHENTLDKRRDEFGRSETTVMPVTEREQSPSDFFSIRATTTSPTTQIQVDHTTRESEQPMIVPTSGYRETDVIINNADADSIVRLPNIDNKKDDTMTTTYKPLKPKPRGECITKSAQPKPTASSRGVITKPSEVTTKIPNKKVVTTPKTMVGKEFQNSRGKKQSIYDRIFFKELSRSMRRSQRIIRYRVQQSVKYLYASVSKRIGNFQDAEGENEFNHAANAFGEMPSNDDDDLNRQLKPIWLKQYHNLVKHLQNSIKRMRYQVLMMVNRHLRQ